MLETLRYAQGDRKIVLYSAVIWYNVIGLHFAETK